MPNPILDYQKPHAGPKEPLQLGPIERWVQWFFVLIAIGLVGFAIFLIYTFLHFRDCC